MDAWTLIGRRAGEEEKHARALLELSRASVMMRDWPHVEQASRLAASAAGRSGERGVARQVEEIAASLRARRSGLDVNGSNEASRPDTPES